LAEQKKAAETQAAASAVPEQKYTLEQAIALIAQSMQKQSEFQEQLVAATPKRRKSLQEFMAERPEKKMLHDVYQNGRLVNPSGLSSATLKRLDTLAQGTYADGLIHVIRVGAGLDARIHIMYSNKSLEQRMGFYVRFPSFTALVNAIADEMAAKGIKPVMDAAREPEAVGEDK
jgi:hypothetical protein